MTLSKLFWRGLQVLAASVGALALVVLLLILLWLANGAILGGSGVTDDGEIVMVCGTLFDRRGWPLTLLDLLTVPCAIVTACVWLFKFSLRRANDAP